MTGFLSESFLVPGWRQRSFLGAVIIALSVSFALKANSSLSWLLGSSAGLGLVALGYVLRKYCAEFLFFLIPLIVPAISALTGSGPNLIALIWVVLVFVYWYFRSNRDERRTIPIRTPYLWIFLVYLALFFLSIFANPFPNHVLSMVFQACLILPVYLMFSRTLNHQRLKSLLLAFVLGGVLSGLVFALALMKTSPILGIPGLAAGVMRPVVLGYKANYWPYPIMFSWLILLSLFVHRQPNSKDWMWMIPVALFLLLIVMINNSRSVLLGTFLGTVFVLCTHPGTKRLLLWSTIPLMVIGIALSPLYLSKLEILLRLQSGLAGREELWPIAWELIEKHPFLGIGPGNFREHLFLNAPLMGNGLLMVTSDPTAHNLFLHTGSEMGFLAPLLMLILLVVFVWRCWHLWDSLRRHPDFLILVAICAVMVGGIARSLVETEFFLQPGFIAKNIYLLVILALQDQLSIRAKIPG